MMISSFMNVKALLAQLKYESCKFITHKDDKYDDKIQLTRSRI